MPSSFTRVLSSALVFSTCPPVSVCGTAQFHLKLRDFSWECGINYFVTYVTRIRISVLTSARIFQSTPPTYLNRDFQHPDNLAYFVPPSLQSQSTGILTCFPSATLLSLTLGADSPCADERRAGNLRLTACGNFPRIIVTHVSIRASDTSSNLLKLPSQAYRTLLYHAYQSMHP